jgi:CheY-like chemotaxis protein
MQASARQSSHPAGSALAVSRDRTTLSVLKALLEELGYAADGALSGTDGVRELKARRYDVVVATMGVPPINGYGLWALMQNSASLEDIPFVLALMQHEYTHLLKDGRELPSNLIIPFGADSLARAIERSRLGEVEVFEI